MIIKPKNLLYLYLFTNIIRITPILDSIPVNITNNQLNNSSIASVPNQPPKNLKKSLYFGIGIYTCIVAYNLFILNLFKKGWNSWHSELSLEKLKKIPPQELYQQLHENINLNSENNSISEQYNQFLSDTYDEIIFFKRYILLNSFLHKLKIGILFFSTPKNIQIAEIRIRKLNYLRMIAIEEYKTKKLENCEKTINNEGS